MKSLYFFINKKISKNKKKKSKSLKHVGVEFVFKWKVCKNPMLII